MIEPNEYNGFQDYAYDDRDESDDDRPDHSDRYDQGRGD